MFLAPSRPGGHSHSPMRRECRKCRIALMVYRYELCNWDYWSCPRPSGGGGGISKQPFGLSALARDAAEDAAATKLVRSVGKRVRLVDGPFKQPLGQRTAGEVWRRQVRWARLRRDAFVECYAMEIFSTSWLAIAAAAVAALVLGMSPLSGIIPLLSIWYGSEAALAISVRWPLSVRSPIAWLLRDLLLPVLWAAGWFGSKVQWRGTPIPVTNKTGTLASLRGA